MQKGADPDDVELAALDESPGWNVLKQHMVKLREGIDQKLAEGVASGQTAEEIGKSTILAVMAKQLLDSIVNKVSDAVLAVEEVKHEGKPETEE